MIAVFDGFEERVCLEEAVLNKMAEEMKRFFTNVR